MHGEFLTVPRFKVIGAFQEAITEVSQVLISLKTKAIKLGRRRRNQRLEQYDYFTGVNWIAIQGIIVLKRIERLVIVDIIIAVTVECFKRSEFEFDCFEFDGRSNRI